MDEAKALDDDKIIDTRSNILVVFPKPSLTMRFISQQRVNESYSRRCIDQNEIKNHR